MSKTYSALIGLAMSGCASSQLKLVTVDVASSVNALYTEQAITNIRRFIDDPDTIPSQVDISTGTITLQNQASFGINIPYGNSVQRNIITLSQGTITNNPETFTPSVSGYWQAAWNISPVGDAVTPWRLRALYRYITSKQHEPKNDETTDLPIDDTDRLIDDYDMGTVLAYGAIVDVNRLREPRCVICVSPDVIRNRPWPKDDTYDVQAIGTVAELQKHIERLRLDAKLKDQITDLRKRVLEEYPHTTIPDHIILPDLKVLHKPPFYINPLLKQVKLVDSGKLEEQCSKKNCVSLGQHGQQELFISTSALSNFVLFLFPQGDARSQMSPPGAADGKK